MTRASKLQEIGKLQEVLRKLNTYLPNIIGTNTRSEQLPTLALPLLHLLLGGMQLQQIRSGAQHLLVENGVQALPNQPRLRSGRFSIEKYLTAFGSVFAKGKLESAYEGKILLRCSLISDIEGKPCAIKRSGLNRYSAFCFFTL